MGLFDWVPMIKNKAWVAVPPPADSYAAVDMRARKAWDNLAQVERQLGVTDATQMVRQVLSKSVKATARTVGIPDIGFKGARQQLFQRFNLIDLYAIAHNNSTLKTATMGLKQEVFRRGLTWEPAFEHRCSGCGMDATKNEMDAAGGQCKKCAERGLDSGFKEPDTEQRVRFEQLIQQANIYGQSLLRVLEIAEDDLNIADDAFLFISSDYELSWAGGEEVIRRKAKQIFRLDPIFVEFDTDAENRPGFAHHLCLAHRDNLLTIPQDEHWDQEWRGRCLIDGHTTFPVIYRYTPARGGYFGARPAAMGAEWKALYLVKGEIIHSSKFSPSELYGYSPVLAIYEKVLSLIGMDRYLYDYFFERQVPQGVVTTVTDNPEDLEVRKEQMLAEVLNNPHHIPWLAVSSKTGQGRTEFVRFAFSLDELQFLPVQEHIERAVAGIYGVPDLFMGFEQSYGGLGNESQQLTRMSRGALLSQDVYNTELLPQLLRAFGITDWTLTLAPAEERTESVEWELKQRKAQWAEVHVRMGFGVEYNQDEDEYEITGSIKPKAEQEQGGGFGGFGGGGFGGGGGDEELPGGGGGMGTEAPEPEMPQPDQPGELQPPRGEGMPTRGIGGQV